MATRVTKTDHGPVRSDKKVDARAFAEKMAKRYPKILAKLAE